MAVSPDQRPDPLGSWPGRCPDVFLKRLYSATFGCDTRAGSGPALSPTGLTQGGGVLVWVSVLWDTKRGD